MSHFLTGSHSALHPIDQILLAGDKSDVTSSFEADASKSLLITIFQEKMWPYAFVSGNYDFYKTHVTNCITNETWVNPLLPDTIVGKIAANNELQIVIHKSSEKIKDYTSKIPATIRLAILTFLKHGRPPRKFDCTDFIAFIHNKSSDAWIVKCKTDKARSVFCLNEEFKLSTGDVVFLTPSPEKLSISTIKFKYHWALYINKTTFLSLFGTGPLAFSSLDEMLKIYEPDRILVFSNFL